MKNAKAKRTRNNVIVHIILAILAAIWVFPIFWVILTSFHIKILIVNFIKLKNKFETVKTNKKHLKCMKI